MGKFIGPFEVEKVVTPVSYKLKLPAHIKAHPVFHISLLRRYQHPNENTPDIMPDPVELLEDGQGAIFVVDKILDRRTYRGKVQYLVKWKGYDESENQWRYLKDLADCSDAVADFEA